MVNINFFEKKKKNITPWVITGTALILSGLLVFYFSWMTSQIREDITINERQIEQQQAVVIELQRVNLIGDQVNQLKRGAETLQANKYPAKALYDEMIDQIPNLSDTLINQFIFSITGNVQLQLALPSEADVVSLQRQLLDLPYVTNVVLETIEVTGEAATYDTRFSIMIDRLSLSEVLSRDL